MVVWNIIWGLQAISIEPRSHFRQYLISHAAQFRTSSSYDTSGAQCHMVPGVSIGAYVRHVKSHLQSHLFLFVGRETSKAVLWRLKDPSSDSQIPWWFKAVPKVQSCSSQYARDYPGTLVVLGRVSRATHGKSQAKVYATKNQTQIRYMLSICPNDWAIFRPLTANCANRDGKFRNYVSMTFYLEWGFLDF